jgi:DNA-directed RNA polymerase specialized sigma24 family protein
MGSRRVLRLQSDSRLAALTRRGHDAAFAELVRRYRERVERYCRHLLPGEEADDAIEATFLNAWAALGAGEAADEVRPWLQRVTHHAVVGKIATCAHMRGRFDRWLASGEVGHDGLEFRLATIEALVELGGLDMAQRDALVLAVRGYRHDQAAQALGLDAAMAEGLGSRIAGAFRGVATALTPRWFAAICARPRIS